MKQLISFRESLASSTHCRAARLRSPVAMALLMAASALACSEENPVVGSGGAGGQATAPTAGSAVTAGTTSTPTAGMPAATSGAAGMVSTGGAGTAGSSAGAGGSSAGSGGSGGAAGGAGGSGGNGGSGGSGGDPNDGWTPLFNGKNLDGWTPSQGHAGLFAVTQLAGESVIQVYPTQADQSTQPQGSLRTNASYSKYVYHMEYKWGTKRFSDRKQTARDNGICFHICNNPATVWPDSVEFQIGSDAWGNDWVTGNIFMLVSKTRAQWSSATLNGKKAFSETGTKANLGAPASYALGLSSAQLDKPNDWNTIDLTVHGSTDAEYKVNGTVVNRVFDMECDEGQGFKPLDHGPIAVQAEFAEVYFRNIKIKVLP